MHPDALLEALDPQQRAVALQVTGPLAVRAGAGTGKTRAITYRIAYGAAVGAYDPHNVLAVTFTARAAAEMRARLAKLGVPQAQARTFHAAALRQLRYFWPTVIGGELPTLIEHKASLVAAATHRVGIRADKDMVRDLAAEIEWAKVSMVDAENYQGRLEIEGRSAPAGLSADDVARLFDAYEDAKEERGGIDFEDVLLIMSGMMQERDDIATRVRAQYRSFVVDEYQDVSRLQQHLLNLWLGQRRDICVVGDAAQTIYSFAGASERYLLEFAQRHKGANIVELSRDYRSTPQIVDVANRLMDPATPGGPASNEGRVHLVSQCVDGPQVTYRAYDNDRAEADAIAQTVMKYVANGVPLHDIAILYRTNSQSELFEQALSDAQIPFLIRGGARFFEREEIRRALLALRRAHTDTAHGANVDEVSMVEQVKEALTLAGWSSEPPAQRGAVRERWDNLQALLDLAQENPDRSLTDFLTELEERVHAQAAPAVAGVTLTTIHAAKGLEWDAVFLAGLSEGLLPISYATTESARDEERRLLYVGITRAKRYLELSWASSRNADSGRASRKRSRFLDGLWPQEGQGRRQHARATPRPAPGKEAAKQFDEEQSPAVRDLFTRLRAWRLEEARATHKPPFAVFTDHTLRSIAVAQPRTMTQLRIIRGVGDVKLERYGQAVLAIVRGETVVVEDASA